MRECYAEAARDPAKCPIATWQDAFKADPHCGVMDLTPDGSWTPWTALFPTMPGLPGDPEGAPTGWTVADYLSRSITLVRTLLETVRSKVEGKSANAAGPVGAAPAELTGLMARLMRYGGLAGLGGLIQGLQVLDEVARTMPRFPGDLILKFHAALADSARAEIEAHDASRRGLASTVGGRRARPGHDSRHHPLSVDHRSTRFRCHRPVRLPRMVTHEWRLGAGSKQCLLARTL